MTYETACTRIEEVIRRLDSGEAGLRETLELCQEGRRLVEFCAGELDAVAQGLEELRLDELVARLEAGSRPAAQAAACRHHRAEWPPSRNRALLARQGLLERSTDPIPRLLERMAGLQAQYAPSMYIGLWSRLEGFERADLTRALEDRSVVQGTLMRSTIHLVSREDYWPFALAVREARRTAWLRSTKRDPPEAAAEQVRAALAGGNTLRRKEIEALIGKEAAHGVGLWVDLVRAPPSGTWERRRADLYALAEDWIGPPEIGEQAAQEHLVRRYLAGFGPATAKDVASFTGLPAAVVDGLDLDARGRPPRRRPARRAPTRTHPPRRASSARGTRACSSTPAAAASSPRSTGRRSSTPRRRSRSRPSRSTAPSPAPGSTWTAGSSSARSAGSPPPTAARSRPRPRASPRCTR